MSDAIMMTPAEFCEIRNACDEGREWAIAQPDMATVWNTAKHRWLIWIAQRALPAREIRLFACFCARQNWHLLTDARSRKAVEVAEAYCRGDASTEELAVALDAADAASHYAATTSSAAATASATAAAAAAYYSAAAAYYAAAAATAAAAYSAALDALDAVKDEQCAWLRENCTPDFSRERGTR